MDGSFFVFLAEHPAATTFALIGVTAIGIALWRHTEGCKKARTELRESVKKSEDNVRILIKENTDMLILVRERLAAVEQSNSTHHMREMQTLLHGLLNPNKE